MYTWISISAPEDFGKLAHLFKSRSLLPEGSASDDGEPSVEDLNPMPMGAGVVDVTDDEDDSSVHEQAAFAEMTRAYGLESVAQELSMALRPAVKGLLVEFSYVDKDYRSTYYHYYAKKGRRYEPNCLRVHLFGEGASYDEATMQLLGLTYSTKAGRPNQGPDQYLGFFTLRPTFRNTIGRSILSPAASDYAKGYVLSSAHKVHLLGYDLTVSGFPWMKQHIDISVCAHVACWAILRHYSERYRKYREYLTYDITRSAYEFDRGGLVPSNGLTIAHAERVFSEARTFPVVVRKTEGEQVDSGFYRQLLAYLESGFPLFAKVGRDHAVAIVGVEWAANLASNSREQPDTEPAHAWDMVNSLVTIDDNFLPYTRLGRTAQPPQKRGVVDIDVFIAPLPDKIYYPAEPVDVVSTALPKVFGELLDFPEGGDCVIRYFVTTTASMRRHMRERPDEFAPSLIEAVMKLPLPQFVWVVEFSSVAEWYAEKVAVCALIDATASRHDDDPLWAIFDSKSAVVIDRTTAKGRNLDLLGKGPYSRMQSNLSAVSPK